MTMSVEYWWYVTDMGKKKKNLSHCNFEYHRDKPRTEIGPP
jgi:hypothetical protein